ncbi:MAG TPA: aminotransferase class III-fold pyridoxal phosphate-dependent enzyme, partial [Cytophagales bacterium]|nr:aminotransferase class III-fold pyridoxal phosphate-dependent enzyme [Cytophagales bacterium]
TGFYRTGRLLASHHLVNSPDIVCLSKGITGGLLPLGATLCKEHIYTQFATDDIYKTFFHGHSYTGNPLALALADTSLELLQQQHTLQRILTISEKQAAFATALLGKHQHIRCSTLGTVLSIEITNTQSTGYFSSLKERIYNYFLERDLLLRPLGNVLYFLPMYCFSETQMDTVHSTIDDFITELKD